MVVWGGWDGTTALSDGGRYDPIDDSWLPTSPIGAPPEGRIGHSAIWTGQEMILWGGNDQQFHFGTGYKYRPDTDTWQAISTSSAPAPMSDHCGVWTGRLMIVWGAAGGRYDPAFDTWSPVSGVGASYGDCVWTGDRMIVWNSKNSTGGRYLADTSPDADHDGTTTCGGDCDDGKASVYAGAPEICDGISNDCSDPMWPGLLGTIEGDDDADDLSECQGDCDDASAAAWNAPGPIDGLTFIDDVTLIWSAPAQPGGATLLYDALRATESTGFASSMTCMEYEDSGTIAIDRSVPPLGSIAYYLARAQNGCGLGSAGAASDGAPRPASDCQPPPSPGSRLFR
jgi:hypothetical protein